MSKSGFGQMYRKLSSKLIDLVVTPHVLGEVPAEPAPAAQSEDSTSSPQKIVCYVLLNHSRSNALVVDGETRRLKLQPALNPLVLGQHSEKASVLFLQHRDENNLLNPPPHAFPPRLLRMIDALEQQPDLDVELIPVTLLWGRDPEKEDSWLKLLFTDTWSTPSKVKQLVNIGLHGRQTYIEFHQGQSLRALIDYAKTTHPNSSPATYIISTLNERCCNEVHIVFDTEDDIFFILLGDRRQADGYARNSNAFTSTHNTAVEDFCHDVFIFNINNRSLDFTNSCGR